MIVRETVLNNRLLKDVDPSWLLFKLPCLKYELGTDLEWASSTLCGPSRTAALRHQRLLLIFGLTDGEVNGYFTASLA